MMRDKDTKAVLKPGGSVAVGGDLGRYALLPNGLRDMLPPEADHETAITRTLMATFRSFGYDRVKPPLVEFEESLAGASGSVSRRVFRLMDPVTQKMMGVRADMTMQIARIAASRLAHRPRPLRLSYAGDVLRVLGSQLSPERQFTQVGAELIGSDSPEADAEIVIMAASALKEAGVTSEAHRLSVDLMVPPLVPQTLAGLGLDPDPAGPLRQALDHKDQAEVARLSGQAAGYLTGLIKASGAAGDALLQLRALNLPGGAGDLLDRLEATMALIHAALPDLMLTVDAVENRGFEYHSGISFSLFAKGVRGELGRGGGYVARLPGSAKDTPGEPATGVSLYMDTVLRALPGASAADKVFAPAGIAPAILAAARAKGRIVVQGLDNTLDQVAEAKALGCSALMGKDGTIVPV